MRSAKSIQRLKVFVDAATVESTRRVLELGLRPSFGSWDLESIRDLTHAMLAGPVHVLPAFGKQGVLPTGYTALVNCIPEFEEYQFSHETKATIETASTIRQSFAHLLRSWSKASLFWQFYEWRDLHKEFAFLDHLLRHGCLFEEDFVPLIAKVLCKEEKDIYELQRYSTIAEIVRDWQTRAAIDAVLLVANCWMLAGMMRHMYHGYLTRFERGRILSHPFRQTVHVAPSLSLTLSQDSALAYFANLIVECALEKPNPNERVGRWLELIKESRIGQATGRFTLVAIGNSGDAAKHALTTARELRMELSSYGRMRALDSVPLRDYFALSELPDVRQLLPELRSVNGLELLEGMIERFSDVAQLLSHRRRNRPSYELADEYDTHDLLYALIKSVFLDAREEDPSPKLGGRSKRIDIVVPSLNAVIEVKHIRSPRHAKEVESELKDDFESYHSHPSCQTVLVLIHDPQKLLRDPLELRMDLSGRRTKNEHSFEVKIVVSH